MESNSTKDIKQKLQDSMKFWVISDGKTVGEADCYEVARNLLEESEQPKMYSIIVVKDMDGAYRKVAYMYLNPTWDEQHRKDFEQMCKESGQMSDLVNGILKMYADGIKAPYPEMVRCYHGLVTKD